MKNKTNVFLSPAERTLGPFAGFLCLFPLFGGLHRLLYLLGAKGPPDPLIIGGNMPQGLVLQLHLLQAVRQSLAALPGPSIVSL